MKKSTLIWVIIIIIVVIIIAIIASNSSTSSTPVSSATDQTTTTPTSEGTVVLNTASSTTLGTLLTATNGMTLYQSANDTTGVSNCSGTCLTAWPPYITSSTAPFMGGSGVSGTIGTITRPDGTMQVTYNGMPLYFFQNDVNSGDATGQNVNGFTVVKP